MAAINDEYFGSGGHSIDLFDQIIGCIEEIIMEEEFITLQQGFIKVNSFSKKHMNRISNEKDYAQSTESIKHCILLFWTDSQIEKVSMV